MRETFRLHQGAIGLIFLGTGCSYFLSSFFTGRLLNLIGIGLLLAVSSGLVALSGFGYALAPTWALFAACALLHGLGSGAIDAGLNHYVANHFSARQMNWLHACYSLGATFGPVIMTGVLAWHGSWRAGYGTVATILLFLTILFAATHRKWDDHGTTHTEHTQSATATMVETLRHPVVWLQIALFFVYTGLEVTLGQWTFTLLTESRHTPAEAAGLLVTCYWGSIGVGRILFGFVVERLGIDRLLRLSTVSAVLGAALFALQISRPLSAIGLVVAGLALAPIYPCMMTRTPERLGKALSAHAIGFQVSAAMLGAAALPSLSGLLAQGWGLESIATAAAAMALILCLIHEILLMLPERRDFSAQ